jgi:hypothetical protein
VFESLTGPQLSRLKLLLQLTSLFQDKRQETVSSGPLSPSFKESGHFCRIRDRILAGHRCFDSRLGKEIFP